VPKEEGEEGRRGEKRADIDFKLLIQIPFPLS